VGPSRLIKLLKAQELFSSVYILAEAPPCVNTYSHVLPGMQEEATGKLEELLSPIDVSNKLKKLGERKPSNIPIVQKIR
jgi:hypothetical protein